MFINCPNFQPQLRFNTLMSSSQTSATVYENLLSKPSLAIVIREKDHINVKRPTCNSF